VQESQLFDRTRDPILTIQDKDLGKIPFGELMKISATRVPRVIGKRGSMIQTIESATSTRITIGQNGLIVVSGKNKDGIELATKAIRMVEEEAHTSNLTQRIKLLLNVQEEIQADSKSHDDVRDDTEEHTTGLKNDDSILDTQSTTEPRNFSA
jgi:exosome complex component RRP4